MHTRGWKSMASDARTQDAFMAALLTIARQLGKPKATRSRKLVDVLTPRSASEAHTYSLSKLTGRGLQPWHIDLAHAVTPARYLVLGMYDVAKQVASTDLLNACEFVPDACRGTAMSEPFLIRTGRNSFYATVLAPSQQFVRLDPGCMIGATHRARGLLDTLVNQKIAPTYTHTWDARRILIVDNWVMLHRRGDASDSDRRVLYRVSVSAATSD